MILDYEGSGADVDATRLEAMLDSTLRKDWGDRAKAIVIEPEVDVWMWGSEQHLRTLAGWVSRESIRAFLESQGFAFDERGKPTRPKEALEAVFKPRSSSHYKAIAGRISLARCQAPAFIRLRAALRQWFST